MSILFKSHVTLSRERAAACSILHHRVTADIKPLNTEHKTLTEYLFILLPSIDHLEIMNAKTFKYFLVGLLSSVVTTVLAIQVGDTLPSIELHHNFPPDKIDIADRLANKKAIIVGLPGAFTPT